MENSLKGLLLAAGTIITCLVVTLGFYIAREAKGTAASGVEAIAKLNAQFSENDKIIYDGLEVSGSEVINVINKFKDSQIAIKVQTKKGITQYINTLNSDNTAIAGKGDTSIKEAKEVTNNSYINPNASFLGEVIRDINQVIIGISFKQED